MKKPVPTAFGAHRQNPRRRFRRGFVFFLARKILAEV